MKIETIDLNFLGSEHIIASFLLMDEGGGSAAIVETGPTTCLKRLTAGLDEHGVSPEDVYGVFLTHIHLDHAGASGHLAELLPNATFHVHEIGFPHLVDPSKLMKSATHLLALVGEKSHTSTWMSWEIDRAKQSDTKLMLAAVKVSKANTTPTGLLNVGTSWATSFERDRIVDALKNAKIGY